MSKNEIAYEIHITPPSETESYKEIAKKLWAYIDANDETGTFEELADIIGLTDYELALCRRLERTSN